jgi:hypothetical protein
MRIGNTQELLNATRDQASIQINLKAVTFTPGQREQMFALVGHSMAEISWGSGMFSNDQKRYEISSLARESAKVMVDAASELTDGLDATLSLGELTLSPAMRQMVTKTREEVLALWAAHTQGR